MAWVILDKAKVVEDNETGELGILAGCGCEVIQVGNQWRDVTSDFESPEQIIPLSYAVVAGNKVLHLTATMQLIEEVSGSIHLFNNNKWHSMVDSTFPIMVIHGNGTVEMIDGVYMPAGYIEADVTGISTSDMLYLNVVVPVQ